MLSGVSLFFDILIYSLTANSEIFSSSKNINITACVFRLTLVYGHILMINLKILIKDNLIRQCIIKHEWIRNNNISIQHIKLYKLLEATTSIIRHTWKLLLFIYYYISCFMIHCLIDYYYNTGISTNANGPIHNSRTLDNNNKKVTNWRSPAVSPEKLNSLI